jgi:hypothetical protein
MEYTINMNKFLDGCALGIRLMVKYVFLPIIVVCMLFMVGHAIYNARGISAIIWLQSVGFMAIVFGVFSLVSWAFERK